MRRDEFLFDLADWLTDPPNGGPIQMWTVGAGFAALVTGYGMACAMTRHATGVIATALVHAFTMIAHS